MVDASDEAVGRGSLLAEYEANIALWQHDDSLRQQRSATFLTVSTVLLTALAALTALQAPLGYVGAIALIFSVFGMIVCRVWHVVQLRNAEYVRFRRLQLLSIEARLPGLTTFKNTYEAFYKGAEVRFLAIGDKFSVSTKAKGRSTVSEGLLPLLVGALWLIVGLAGMAVAFAKWRNGA